jgi:carbonic anhydrase
MKRTLSVFSTMAAGILSLPAAAQEHHPWGYEGEGSPSAWAELSEEFRECGLGQQQSPIDIISSEAIGAAFEPVDLHWQSFNTHSLGGYAEMGGVRYELLQFHFHHQSEHMIDGHNTPMEVHFVHASEAGNLLMLGVLLEAGAPDPTVEAVWSVVPREGEEIAGEGEIDPSSLLPVDRGSFRYEGSLTTPPCSQIVTWNVYAHADELSSAQIELFAGLYENDARPVQPLNRRFVLSDDAER